MTLAASSTVAAACREMRDRRVGSVLVSGKDGHLVGIFTGRDAVSRVLAAGKSARNTKLSEVMTPDPKTVSPNQTAIEARRMIVGGRVPPCSRSEVRRHRWRRVARQHELKVKELQRQLERMDNATVPVAPTFNYNYVPTQPVAPTKPYKNIKLVNETLTIVLNDGSIMTKPGATNDDFIAARKASTEEQLLGLVANQEIVAERKREEAEIARASALKEGINKLAWLEDFRVDGGSVYLTGIDRSLPQLLVEEFVVIASRNNFNSFLLAKDEEFQSLYAMAVIELGSGVGRLATRATP